MKVLIIRNFPSFMDVKHNTYNIQEVGLAKALIRRGHTCDIVFWTDAEEKEERINFDENHFLTVFYRHSKVILKNAIFPDLDDLIEKYDVIQPCEYNQLQSWLLAKKYPQKTVIFHGPYYSEFNRRYNMMCQIADLLLVPAYRRLNTQFLVKSDLAKQFLSEKGISRNCITVSGVGIDIESLSKKDNDPIPEELLKIQTFHKKLKLLYIGRLEPRRNIPFLFNIVKELSIREIPAELIIIGNGSEDYVRQAFDHASKLGVMENVYWIKKAEQKYLYYAYDNSDIFLLPTHYEIFGMVLLEAMYFRKPVITTANGGSSMLIESNRNGVVIDEFDVAKWCDAIIQLQGNKEIGNEAHEKVADNYTWDHLSNIFVAAYQRKISESG